MHRTVLPVIAEQLDRDDLAVSRGTVFQNLPARVAAAVVDGDDLVIETLPFEEVNALFDSASDHCRAVEDRDYRADAWLRRGVTSGRLRLQGHAVRSLRGSEPGSETWYRAVASGHVRV